MILSYEGAATRGGVRLKEVASEEEAFFEMRRFLEVNHIQSNYTEVSWKDENSAFCVATCRHKRVEMCNMPREGATFGIYYEGQPAHQELGPESKWNIDRDTWKSNNMSYHYKASTGEFVCWYDEVQTYLNDLALRQGGDDSCH